MYVIGLTGGICSGKSAVAKYLKTLGAVVWDADVVARKVVMPGHRGYEQIREAFGEIFFSKDGTLDRKRMGDYIFANPDKREVLNAIVHPLVEEDLVKSLGDYRKGNVQVVILDVPLLLESGMDRYADTVWVTSCGEDEQIRRLMQRNTLSIQQAWERLDAQMPDVQRRQNAQRVIDTSQDVEDTQRFLRAVYEELLEEIK